MDFTFGTFATDQLKLVHHRATKYGIYHGYLMSPRDPAAGESVTLTAYTGVGISASQVACYYTMDGSLPTGSKGIAQNGQVIYFDQVDITWDTITWGYVTRWQAMIPPQPEGTQVRYRIGAWTGEGAEAFADYPEVNATAERAADAFFRGLPVPEMLFGEPVHTKSFNYYVDNMQPPQWAYDAVIYQVFVDRFYPGDGKSWNENVQSLSDFYGGTLWGVRDKLDYIADLGATCIWLSPTWVSPSHHGYDITDFEHVEPRLGGDEALRALVEAAHQRGIRVLLDMVCNHLAFDHPYFQEARNDPNSPYREWFTFDGSDIGYRTYFGVASMPEINTENPAARRWLIETAQYWLREFDVDGYRLDHANGPGAGFWSDFVHGCKQIKPDCFCFGEIVDEPSVMLAFVGRLDGCIDFHLSDALRLTYGRKVWSEADLERFLDRHRQYFPANFLMPTFLDNHDMDRFLYIANGDKDALRRAAAVQMKLPAPPVIYYGTEIGITQRKGKNDGWGLEVSREPMPWGDTQDQDLLNYYKMLIRQRR